MSSPVFVICNQHGHYWGKNHAWVDGKDPKEVVQTKHHDEALNTLIELGAKDVDLRGKIVPADLTGQGQPELTVSDIPVPVIEEEEEPSPELAVEIDNS